MYRCLFIIALSTLLPILMVGCSKESSESKTAGQATVRATQSGISAAQNTATGSIQGRVIFDGEVPRARRLMMVKDTDVCGRSEQFDRRLIVCESKGIQNAVVYLAGIAGGKPLSSLGSRFILDQRGCRYDPHVLLVPVNTPLQILNDDGILHNFHSFSKKNRPVNMSQPKFRRKMEMTFDHPEFIQARCDVHGWMSCWIIAVDHPYYAITDAEGNFSLDDIPPGTYTLNCWQETLGDQSAQVTVAPGSPVLTSFSFSGKGT